MLMSRITFNNLFLVVYFIIYPTTVEYLSKAVPSDHFKESMVQIEFAELSRWLCLEDHRKGSCSSLTGSHRGLMSCTLQYPSWCVSVCDTDCGCDYSITCRSCRLGTKRCILIKDDAMAFWQLWWCYFLPNRMQRRERQVLFVTNEEKCAFAWVKFQLIT